MSKMMHVAMAVMFTFLLVGLFSTAMYSGSNDPDKYQFSRYTQYDNQTGEILEEGNVTLQNGNDSISNFQKIGEAIQNSIKDAQVGLNKGTIQDTLGAAFGVTTTLGMQFLFLLMAVLMEAVNLVYGIGANLSGLPYPFSLLGDLLLPFIGTALFIFLIFKLIEWHKGGTG